MSGIDAKFWYVIVAGIGVGQPHSVSKIVEVPLLRISKYANCWTDSLQVGAYKYFPESEKYRLTTYIFSKQTQILQNQHRIQTTNADMMLCVKEEHDFLSTKYVLTFTSGEVLVAVPLGVLQKWSRLDVSNIV